MLIQSSIFDCAQCLAYATSPLAATGWLYLSTLGAWGSSAVRGGVQEQATYEWLVWHQHANIRAASNDDILFLNKVSKLIIGPIKKHFA